MYMCDFVLQHLMLGISKVDKHKKMHYGCTMLGYYCSVLAKYWVFVGI